MGFIFLMPVNDLQGRTVLLVHACSPRKSFILRRMKELGVRIVCLNRTKTDFAEPFVDQWILAELNNIEECAEAVQKFVAANPNTRIDGVVTYWDECILVASKLSDDLGLPGIPLTVSETIKNKYLFREMCNQKNVPAPLHMLLTSLADIDKADTELTYPLILKPIYGASSAFVVKVENKQELKKAYENVLENIQAFWLAPEWRSHEMLVEEYVSGDEVDIDILIQEGQVQYISIIDNAKTREPFFVETGWSAPSALSEVRQKNLKEMATRVLSELGVRNGCIHFEAKSNPNGTATPIEVNLRMGGGEVYVYSKQIWGVDLVEGATRIALGMPVMANPPAKPLTYVISYRFLSDESCLIEDIKVDDELRGQPYFVDLYFEKKVGEVFLAPPVGYDRSIGVLTVRGESPEDVQSNLQKALDHIHITTNSHIHEVTK